MFKRVPAIGACKTLASGIELASGASRGGSSAQRPTGGLPPQQALAESLAADRRIPARRVTDGAPGASLPQRVEEVVEVPVELVAPGVVRDILREGDTVVVHNTGFDNKPLVCILGHGADTLRMRDLWEKGVVTMRMEEMEKKANESYGLENGVQRLIWQHVEEMVSDVARRLVRMLSCTRDNTRANHGHETSMRALVHTTGQLLWTNVGLSTARQEGAATQTICANGCDLDGFVRRQSCDFRCCGHSVIFQ